MSSSTGETIKEYASIDALMLHYSNDPIGLRNAQHLAGALREYKANVLIADENMMRLVRVWSTFRQEERPGFKLDQLCDQLTPPSKGPQGDVDHLLIVAYFGHGHVRKTEQWSEDGEFVEEPEHLFGTNGADLGFDLTRLQMRLRDESFNSDVLFITQFLNTRT
ncbi:uncharacterized protein LTR77_008450 [Saxophila tyrrhenica]|uniref:Uncharacterized protein n=1 Tax=Saxophila tyrrhenica TaxID=1690608 RepID=A0AAV9P0Z3_9PEZI|nr:hypothetical protein LTR77_008450 [Saxophila tyrrhenica]